MYVIAVGSGKTVEREASTFSIIIGLHKIFALNSYKYALVIHDIIGGARTWHKWASDHPAKYFPLFNFFF